MASSRDHPHSSRMERQPMKKTTKNNKLALPRHKTAATCGAVASSGGLVCALPPGHGTGPGMRPVHSTVAPSKGKKPMQHATWTETSPGQITVTTHSHGKRMSDWTEAAPIVEAEDDPRPEWLRKQTEEREAAGRGKEPNLVDACKKCGLELGEHDGKKCPKPAVSSERLETVFSLVAACGHVGVKTDELSSIHYKALRELERAGRIVYRGERWYSAEHDVRKPLTLDDEPEDEEPSEAALAMLDQEDDDRAARWACGAAFIGDDGRQRECEGRNEHNGPHYAFCKVLDRIVNDGTAPNVVPRPQDDDEEGDDPLEDEVRSDADRDLARQLREAREAHAQEIEESEASPIATSSPTTSTTVGETITCAGRKWPIHPAARIFPTPEPQYRALVESIRVNGQKHPIELLGDPGFPVIDGCSRLRACAELGIEPRTKVISVENPYKHVFAVNLDRRHLDESQRAMAAADLATLEHGANQHTRTGGSAGPRITQTEAAKLAGASERLTRDAARVKNNAVPEVAQAIREGRIRVGAGVELAKLQPAKQREILGKVTEGKGEVKSGKVRSLVKQEEKRQVVRKLNEGRVPTIGTLTSDFGVVLSDPAWPYDNSDQHEGSRGHIPYPGQPVEDIVRLHAVELPARTADDAILFLCVTNAFVPVAVKIAESGAWTWRTMITLVKSRTGMGTWPRGRTEHIVILSKGNPTHTLNEITTWLADRVIEMPREHSQKPEELYQVIEKHCGGPRLEMYARSVREGWSAWGAEADKPKKKSKILTETDKRIAAGSAA